jgi:antitoxin VapB
MGVVTKTFKSGNSVALRLPKELGIVEGTELLIEKKSGGWMISRMAKYSGRDLVEALAKLPKPKSRMKRVRIEFPKRNWHSAKPD